MYTYHLPSTLVSTAERDYRMLKINLQRLYKLFDYMLTSSMLSDKEHFNIHSNTIQKIAGHEYTRYVNFLKDSAFISVLSMYTPGFSTRGYRIADWVYNDDIVQVNMFGDIIEYNDYPPLYKSLKGDFSKLGINKKSANEWVSNNMTKNIRALWHNKLAIEKIHTKNSHFVVDGYGRLHTVFTVLKKHIRNNFCTIGGKQVAEVDIKNSQPLFLSKIMIENGHNAFDDFIPSTINGTVYDNIANNTSISRDAAKIECFKTIFGPPKDRCSLSNPFRQTYPQTWKWLRDYKRLLLDYRELAHDTQSAESFFMYQILVPKIKSNVKGINLLTVHDSITCQSNHRDKISEIVNEELQTMFEPVKRRLSVNKS